MDPVTVASAERERERESAKRPINFPRCHDQPNINFWKISHSFKEIVGFFTTTDAAFVWIKFHVVWKVALDGRIILRWIFRNFNVGILTGSSRLRTGTCECGIEPSDSIKCVEFLDLLKTCYLLMKDSALWSD